MEPTDLTHLQRVTTLSSGEFRLNATTVFDDVSANTLPGASGHWFFTGRNDRITDAKPSEIVIQGTERRAKDGFMDHTPGRVQQ